MQQQQQQQQQQQLSASLDSSPGSGLEDYSSATMASLVYRPIFDKNSPLRMFPPGSGRFMKEDPRRLDASYPPSLSGLVTEEEWMSVVKKMAAMFEKFERELPPPFKPFDHGCCYACCGCLHGGSPEAPQFELDYQASIANAVDTAWKQVEDVFVGVSKNGLLWTVVQEGVQSADQVYYAKMRAKKVAEERGRAALIARGGEIREFGETLGRRKGYTKARDIVPGLGVMSEGQRHLCIVKWGKAEDPYAYDIVPVVAGPMDVQLGSPGVERMDRLHGSF